MSTCASELTDGGVYDSCIGSSALNISYVLGVICGGADGG
jgi:hypothetical protein